MTYPAATLKAIQKQLNKLNSAEKYKKYADQEAAIKFLFGKYPDNNDLNTVLLKVSTLNDFYSTNIRDTYTVARHIFENQARFSEIIENKRYELVNDLIAMSFPVKDSKERKIRKNYSFVTKYLSHHKPECFPISDGLVRNALIYYRDDKKDNKGFYFKNSDLFKYDLFVNVIRSFRAYCKAEELSYREIDLFLWSVGREHREEERAKALDLASNNP